MVIQPDGKIVAAGGAAGNFGLARYNPNGSLDNSFDGDGRVTTDFVPVLGDEAFGVAIQPDGKIVAAGVTDSGANPQNFALARYNPNGSLDNSFDGDGRVTTDFGAGDTAHGVAIRPDGKIVVAGSRVSGVDPATVNFALARYNANGTLDSGFGTAGKVITDFGGLEQAFALAIQPDGRVVAAGVRQVGGGSDFALARYLGDQADLYVTKSDAGFDSVNNGESVTFTPTVTNSGPNGASGVVVTDTLPAELDFTSASAGCSETAPGSNVVECAIGSLANGSTTTLTVTATATASGTFTDTASVTGNEADPNTPTTPPPRRPRSTPPPTCPSPRRPASRRSWVSGGSPTPSRCRMPDRTRPVRSS